MKRNLYSIYNEELEELAYEPKGVVDLYIQKMLRKWSATSDLKYAFTVPASDYLRGQLFCSDVSEAMEEAFTQRDLISILLDDLLFQAKKEAIRMICITP